MLENLDRGMSGESRCGAPEFEDILSTRRAALKKLGRFTSISAPAVTLLLAAVAALPVEAWRYKPETGLGTQPHIGPYAEDFQAAFGVGDGVTINPIDAIGVCLAAIKALSKRVEELEAQLMAKGHGEAA